ncbi:MAG: hypothetical protein QW727_00515 [Candidatus Pacearchaeota archaeon]
MSLNNDGNYFSPFYDEKTRIVLVIKVGKEIKTLSISGTVILKHTFRAEY